MLKFSANFLSAKMIQTPITMTFGPLFIKRPRRLIKQELVRLKLIYKNTFTRVPKITSKCSKMSENMMSLKTAFYLNDIKTYL